MNRWIARVVTLVSLTGAVALAPAGVAFAQQAAAASQPGAHHGHRMGLIGDALKLDSLTPSQRSAIEQLAQTRRTAEVPVRQADAQVLTVLAQQVEQASIDRQALAPTMSARETAAEAARTVDLDTVQKLHDLLTPAQRGQLIDAMEANAQAHAGHGKGGPGRGGHLAEIAKKLGLTDQQKQQIASNLHAERQGQPQASPRRGRPRGLPRRGQGVARLLPRRHVHGERSGREHAGKDGAPSEPHGRPADRRGPRAHAGPTLGAGEPSSRPGRARVAQLIADAPRSDGM